MPRPLRITTESTSLDGAAVNTAYQLGLARLIQHDIDHLNGLPYTDRVRPGVLPICVVGVPADWPGLGYDS
ncbi:peptide deformylase [Streptomyces sp. NPDC058783]|uniref:peptide deformylase n=1 Tax=Streptomyces sp. NPDC058783 TaxID=3346633 RepID=UPI0036A53990